MTRRDVAVWFCKVIGLIGIINAVFSALSQFLLVLGLRRWGNFGFSLPSLVLYLFVYLFAGSIGTELAAEGEHGLPIASGRELNGLFWRCIGLGLFLSATSGFAAMMLQVGLTYFSSRSTFSPLIVSFYTKNAIISLVQSAIGFALAFGPRIRLAMQPK